MLKLIRLEWKKKTINLMFSYPINRKKILLSQMLSVWIFNFTALVLSKILIYCSLVALKKYLYITAESIALGNIMFYITLLIISAIAVFLTIYKLETQAVL